MINVPINKPNQHITMISGR